MLSPRTSLSARISAVIFAAATLVSTSALSAQVGASTLNALLERADVVVQARTSGIPSGNAAVHRFRFRTEVTLVGKAPAGFDLSEPAGRSCGRALGGLAQGRYLLFMEQGNGGLRLVVSGARAVVPAEPTVLAHVRALLAAPRGRDRLDVLATALASSVERIRSDAAVTLAHLPALTAANNRNRSQLAAALRRGLGGDTSATHLLVAAERLRLVEVLDDLLDAYLNGRHLSIEPLLLRAIPRIDGEAAARSIAAALPTDASGRRRAVTLLADLPPAAARQPLVELLTGATDTAAVRAGAALLAAGADPNWIERHAEPSVLEAIRRTASRRPQFRSILRESRR